MPWWPCVLCTSANTKATSVSGFCRPVSTFASLIGRPSGRKRSESLIHAMRSVAVPISTPCRCSVQRTLQRVDEHLRDVVAALLRDLLEAGRAGDVDLGEAIADHVEPDEQQPALGEHRPDG